jgi:hypothetical protein
MFLGNLVLESSVLIRRDRQRATGTFDVAFSAGYDFFLRASELGQVAFLDAVTVAYQMGADDQLSGQRGRLRAAHSNLAVVEKALGTSARAQGLPEPIKRERLARCHHWIGIEEFFEDRRSARRHFAVVLKSRPVQDAAMQRRALLLWFASFLPTPLTLGLRRAKRSLAAARGVAVAPDRRPAAS